MMAFLRIMMVDLKTAVAINEVIYVLRAYFKWPAGCSGNDRTARKGRLAVLPARAFHHLRAGHNSARIVPMNGFDGR